MKKRNVLIACFVILAGTSTNLIMSPIDIRTVDFLRIVALGMAIGVLIVSAVNSSKA